MHGLIAVWIPVQIFFPSVLSFLRVRKRIEGKLAWICSPILNFHARISGLVE